MSDEDQIQVLDQVASLLLERMSGPLVPQIALFARKFLSGAAPSDLAARQLDDLYGSVLAMWHFIEHRGHGAPRFRVYSPELEQHGWQSSHTVVEVVADDQPFLVDSVRMALNANGLTIHQIHHPVLRVRRDADGHLQEILEWHSEDADTSLEAVMQFEVDRQVDVSVLRQIENDVERALCDVESAVADWCPMTQKLKEILDGWCEQPPPVDPSELAEARAFLEWLADNHFTFLGYREYELLQVNGEENGEENGEDVLRWGPGPGLGIRRETRVGGVSRGFAALPPSVRADIKAPNLLVITKSNDRATVHRPGYMDYIGIKRFDAQGRVVGEQRFVGLYTSATYNRSPREIPLLSAKVNSIVANVAHAPGSHAEKALLNILENYPRDLLFQVDETELLSGALEVLQLQERQRIRLLIHVDRFGRFASCIVYVPRDRFNTERRLKLQEILECSLNGTARDFTVLLSESVLARLYFVLQLNPDVTPLIDRDTIETRLRGVMRDWSDDLYLALNERFGEGVGVALHRQYAAGMGPHYREYYSPRMAVCDIEHMQQLHAGESTFDEAARNISMVLLQPREAPVGLLRFKLFRAVQPVHLSDALPMLENMGLRVTEERQSEIDHVDGTEIWLHDFEMAHSMGHEFALDAAKREAFEETFDEVWHGQIENDGFNKLVLLAGLRSRQIVVLRAYCKYLRQIGTPFSQQYIEQALTHNARISGRIIDLFEQRFCPEQDERARRVVSEGLNHDLDAMLESVQNLDEDRILRAFRAAVMATIRTNYFIAGRDPEVVPLAFKFDCALVPDLPSPKPLYEIFVYSPRVEGVHLRGDKVARGGLRWSDRPEDFRTEVLGLVKAQMVKNAVIVPMGSKGGFVPKRMPLAADRETMQQEAIACYQCFIRGLLSLTDNSIDATVVPPKDVVRYDDDDPYLVVAADKGTATFSDIANELAIAHGFWLSDAFASGGSEGYDHKGMGITARGAWESVKRSFRELRIDTQTQPFTVVGIGDMAGDVFGNGMLLSDQIRLVAAFNHQHIFIDPTPDEAVTYAERQRLFALPRSSWADYDESLLSEGGGIYLRSAKSISIGDEAAAALGLVAGAYTPNDLIRALLKAPVDLLWNGGIGTYARADHETDQAVGDRANDALRITASELRCKVIGEGGNLGFTQPARVQYALAGGRINTDAIDNSAGVDCSDHEVNIKILLDSVVANGDMTTKQRNQLLAQMTDEVAELVLQNNYQQTQALTLAGEQAPGMLDVHARLMRALERDANLDRAIEDLPDAEALEERAAAEQGLCVPELAVLLAYTKIELYKALEGSAFPEDPASVAELRAYFPSPIRDQFDPQILSHQLRREIVSTVVANEIVNRAGLSFVFRISEEIGAKPCDIARAYLIVREVFGLRRFWSAVDALDNRINANVQTRMLLNARRLMDRACRWLLRNLQAPIDVDAAITRFRAGALILEGNVGEFGGPTMKQHLEAASAHWCELGVSEELANQAAELAEMLSVLDLVAVAERCAASVDEAARAYFRMAEQLELPWLQQQISALPRDNHWQSLARASLRDDLFTQQAELAAEVLRYGRENVSEDLVAGWLEAHQGPVSRTRSLTYELMAGPSPDFTMLSVAMRELRSLSR